MPDGSFFALRPVATRWILVGLVFSAQASGQNTALSKQPASPTASSWSLEDRTDPVSTRTSQYVTTVVHAQPRGTFKVLAKCDGDRDIRFEVQSQDNRPDILRTPVDSSLNYMTGGQLAPFPLSRGEVPSGIRNSCAHMRVQVGTAGVRQFISEDCGDNRTIKFGFLGNGRTLVQNSFDWVKALYVPILPPQLTDAVHQVAPSLPDVLINLQTKQFETLMHGLIRESDVLSADSMRVEVNLAGPNSEVVPSVLVLNLADPSFRQMESQCRPAPGEITPANMDEALREDLRRQQEAARAAQLAAQVADLTRKGDLEYSNGGYQTAVEIYGRVLSMNGLDEQTHNSVLASSQSAQRALAVQQAMVREQNLNGEWVDRGSNLMWTLKDNGQDINWKNANTFCQTMRTGGFSDWRLPSIDELKGLYARTPARNGTRPGSVPGQYENPFPGIIPSAPAYQIRGGITLSQTGIWSGTSKDGYKDLMWWASFTTNTEAWDTVGDRKAMRALCVRSFTFPQPEKPAQTLANTQPSTPHGPSNASDAETYYAKGIQLAAEAMVDPRAAKIIYSPACLEAFQKYLRLAPNGPHANDAKVILAAGAGTASAR